MKTGGKVQSPGAGEEAVTGPGSDSSSWEDRVQNEREAWKPRCKTPGLTGCGNLAGPGASFLAWMTVPLIQMGMTGGVHSGRGRLLEL